MGAIFKLRHLQTDHLAQTLREVSGFGINVIAAHPHTDDSLPSVDLTVPTCLVFGSEGDGISPNVLDACNKRIAIPMRHGTDSLNVASASAAFLYEVQRQRTAAWRGGANDGRSSVSALLRPARGAPSCHDPLD